MGRGRKKGRGQNKRRPLTMTMGHAKFPKEKNNTKKRDTHDVQADSTLKLSLGPSHDLTAGVEITKARSKVKKVGPGGYLNQSAKHHLLGQGTMPAPMSPVRKQLCQLRGHEVPHQVGTCLVFLFLFILPLYYQKF